MKPFDHKKLKADRIGVSVLSKCLLYSLRADATFFRWFPNRNRNSSKSKQATSMATLACVPGNDFNLV